MMALQTVFKRYELKYLLTEAQKDRVLAAMQPYMALDRYGRDSIRNIYMDTDSYRRSAIPSISPPTRKSCASEAIAGRILRARCTSN